jgi:hypothetical protein
LEVSACPLLVQGRKKTRHDAKHKAQHPHRVDTDDGDGRRMGRIVLQRDEWVIQWVLARETSELLGDLVKIKRIPVAGIWGQLFIAFYEKEGNDRRE